MHWVYAHDDNSLEVHRSIIYYSWATVAGSVTYQIANYMKDYCEAKCYIVHLNAIYSVTQAEIVL